MSMTDETEVPEAPEPKQPPKKQGRGWPKGKPRLRATPVERAPVRKATGMMASPNWEDADMYYENSDDRLAIDKSILNKIEKDYGLSLQWVTCSVRGQPEPLRRAQFERRGWTAVHGTDFDGIIDGHFMPRGSLKETEVDGLVLMARPVKHTQVARKRDMMLAREQVFIKEQALRGGGVQASGADHPSAIGSNRINRSVERLHVPDDN